MADDLEKTEARQATTGTGLRKVLGVSLALAVAAMVVLWLVFFA